MDVTLTTDTQRVELDDEQRWLLAGELARTTSTYPAKGVAPGVAADCRITIKARDWEHIYDVYSGSILHDPATDDAWQFYFGSVIVDWLDPA